MENLSETLKQQAISLGLCAKWTSEWADDSDQQTLIDKYVRGIDFSLAYNWPSNDFIKANFDRDLLHKNLIFVDEHIDLDNAPSGVYIVNGECSGTSRLAPWSVATIYLRHTSYVRIEAGDFSRVFVRLYDDSDTVTKAGEGTAVKVYDRRG